jgi:NADH-quinone oxidoreductase subunit L
MVFLTFHGEPRSDTARDPHPVGWSIKLPLVVLGLLATFIGFVNMVPVAELLNADIEFLHQWLDGPEETVTSVHHYEELLHAENAAHYVASDISPFIPGALSLALALAGAGLAHVLYNVPEPERHTEKLGSVRTLLKHNYYQDEYQVWLAEGVTQPVARAANKFDQAVVDGTVDGISTVSLAAGSRIKRLQTGIVTNYAALLTLGLVALLVVVGLYGGWFA